MTKREKIELEFSRRKYDVLPTEEMVGKVTELERTMDSKLGLWDDEFVYNNLQKLKKLNVSDRRLLLVYSILDSSVVKTATYFKVSRKTILNNITRIKEELEL
jgi:hypothetical protein